MAERAEAIGVAKASMPALPAFAPAVLAGAFIALGLGFSTIVATAGAAPPVTIGNLIGGVGLVGAAYWAIYLRPGREGG